MSVRFSIVIVHYNAPDFLRRCLKSIKTTLPGDSSKDNIPFSHEVLVIDNASNNLGTLPQEFKSCRWISNPENRGWGTAVNQGVRASVGEIILLLNQDAELTPSACAELDRFFRERVWDEGNPMGPVGGKLLFVDGSFQPSCGPFPHLGNLFWRLLLPKRRRKYYWNPPLDRPSRADWVTGAFMAFRREVFDVVGGFDENFFLYYEDVDFCLRAAQQGYPAYYFPQAEAIHHAPYAIRSRPDPKISDTIRDSRLLYFKKHRPVWEYRILKLIS